MIESERYAARVTLSQGISSEILRWRRSMPAYLLLVGLAFGLIDALLFVASAPEVSWDGVFAYQNMWAVFVGPMLVGLIAGSVSHIDRISRGGGTWLRPVTPVVARTSRFAVLAVLTLALNAIAVATPVAVTALVGDATPPMGRTVELIVVLWLSQLGLLAALSRIGMAFGRLSALAAATAWILIAVLFAETSGWTLNPFTWLIRGVLPVIGTHANGVTLESAAALAAQSPWPPAMLGALIAVPILLVPGTNRHPGRGSRPAPLQERTPSARAPAAAAGPGPLQVPRTRAAVGAAVRLVIVPTSLRWLVPAAVLVSAVALRWRTPADALDAYLLLVLPIGSMILPIVGWGANEGGWRALATRPTGTTRPALALLGYSAGLAALVSVLVVATYAALGLDVSTVVRVLFSSVVTAVMLTTAYLWITIRFGSTVTVSVGIVGTVLGALVGGTRMQDRLWLVVPWSWAEYTSAERLALTVPLAVAVTAVSGYATIRAARRAAWRH